MANNCFCKKSLHHKIHQIVGGKQIFCDKCRFVKDTTDDIVNKIKFDSEYDIKTAFPTEQHCTRYLEDRRWKGKVTSPFAPDIMPYEVNNKRYRWKCRKTGKYFDVKTGTIFENSKIPLQKWFQVLAILITNPISSHKLSKKIRVTQSTAWRMETKLRNILKVPNLNVMSDDNVEIDETYVGGKNKNRHWDKKVSNSQGRSCKDKMPFIGIYGRDSGNLMIYAVSNTKKKTIKSIVENNVKKSANVNTDEFLAYDELSKWGFNHFRVNHGDKKYAKGKSHTNSIENGWSRFKRSLNPYYRISRKYSQGYANEFTFRSNTNEFVMQEKFDLALLSSLNKQSTYQQLIS